MAKKNAKGKAKENADDIGTAYADLIAQRDARRAADMSRGSNVDDMQRLIWLKERLFQLAEESLDLADGEFEPSKRGALVQQALSSATGYTKVLEICDKRRGSSQEAK